MINLFSNYKFVLIMYYILCKLYKIEDAINNFYYVYFIIILLLYLFFFNLKLKKDNLNVEVYWSGETDYDWQMIF